MVNYMKLKTNLRLSIQRLKLLEKKKTELALKSRREIAEYLSTGKYERAKIRVEHIIREDYLVEAMEIIEMYCDLLLARFGLIQQMSQLDEGLAEAVSSCIWVAPRLQADCPELKIIADLFAYKYGKQYAFAAKENAMKSVNEKLMHKMGIEAPPKLLVEKYLIEIAKSHNVSYEPDPEIMIQESIPNNPLIDFGEEARGNGGGFPGAGGGGFPSTGGGSGGGSMAAPPPLPTMPPVAGNYASGTTQPIGFVNYPDEKSSSAPVNSVVPSNSEKGGYSFPAGPTGPNVQHPGPPIGPPPNYDSIDHDDNKPTPAPRVGAVPKPIGFDGLNLPDVPTTSPDFPDDKDLNGSNDNVDFDDLAKRFEALKKRK